MLPTIDISLIGVLLGIWSVFKTIWTYATQALNWITQRALAYIIGSKIWATAVFLVVSIALIAGITALLSTVLSYVGQLAVSTLGIPDKVVDLLSLYADFDKLTTLFSTLISSWTVYFVVCGTQYGLSRAVKFYTLLTGGFKN